MRSTCTHTSIYCNTRTATHCNTLQHTAPHYVSVCMRSSCTHTSIYCNTRTATHCSALQHTAPHCTTLRMSMHALYMHTYIYILQHIHCNTLRMSMHALYMHTYICILQHTHCNTLLHTAPRCNTPCIRNILEYAYGEMELDARYGVATISRLLKTIGLFCRIWSLL